MSVIDRFAHGVARFPDKPFLSDGSDRLSYAETNRSVSDFAAALHAASIPPSARIALLGQYSASAMLAILAIYRAGCIFVPLNAAFSVEEHIATKRCGCANPSGSCGYARSSYERRAARPLSEPVGHHGYES